MRVVLGGRWATLDEAYAFLNHRPGKHDQSRHGGGKRGGDFAGRLAGAASGQDALDAAPAAKGNPPTDIVTRGLTDSQIAACDEYRSVFGYRAMNGGLRSGKLDDRTAGHVRDLDGAMASSRLTSDVVVYRGMRDGDVLFGDRLSGDLTGAQWNDKAFLSTSASESVAVNYSRHGLGAGDGPNPVVMRMVAPKGTGAVQLADLDGGAELVLDRGRNLRVAADHGVVDGVRRLDIEVAP